MIGRDGNATLAAPARRFDAPPGRLLSDPGWRRPTLDAVARFLLEGWIWQEIRGRSGIPGKRGGRRIGSVQRGWRRKQQGGEDEECNVLQNVLYPISYR